MKIRNFFLLSAVMPAVLFLASCQDKQGKTATVPFILDHNRMLVDAEFQRKDGSWFKARLWVDTGNPDFLVSESFAQNLGLASDPGQAGRPMTTGMKVRIGGMPVNFDSVNISVGKGLKWLFNTMHNDGNLPSTVLKRYHVVFDYPDKMFTIAEPGVLRPRGIRSTALVNPVNGIIQMDAVIDGKPYSLALDNGASFSYMSDTIINTIIRHHPDWPESKGATGCANIWGHWPGEADWSMVRIPEFQWGALTIADVGIAGLPAFFRGNKDLGAWYSQKTARPVNGFLGPNAFRNYRVEIDYRENAVYFEIGIISNKALRYDMDIAGLTIAPLDDGKYQIIGVVKRNGKSVIEGIEPGDVLLRAGDLPVTGATMGAVTDALRGNPGDIRKLVIERQGKVFTIFVRAERFL